MVPLNNDKNSPKLGILVRVNRCANWKAIISRAFCETIRMTFGVCVYVCVCVCVSRAYHLVLLDGF